MTNIINQGHGHNNKLVLGQDIGHYFMVHLPKWDFSVDFLMKKNSTTLRRGRMYET